MLTRMLEHLIIGAFNRARDRRERPPSKSNPAPPSDHAVLGRVIPPEAPYPVPASLRAASPEEEVTLSPQARLRHLYVLGATGSGKTNLLLRLIESDLRGGRTLCVIDLRGDLVDRILLRLAHLGGPEAWRERLLLLDLRDESHAVGFNPLSGDGDAYSRSLHLLEVLRRQSESWGVQLEETLRNCLLALAETGWTLLEIEPLLSNPAFRSQVLANVTDSRVRSFFARYEALSSAQQLTWSLAVLNKVTPLLSAPALRRVLGQRRSLPLRALLDEQPGSVILVSLAVDRFHEASRLVGGLFVSAFQNAVMARIDRPESERVPAFLYLDEFESMASERFESIVAEGRRFGLGLTLSHQNLHQMPPRLKAVIRNNVHAQVFFQTGALDAAELAGDLSSEELPREAARAALMGQGVGEAFVARRGKGSCRIRTMLCPDPRVSQAQVRELRQVALASYAATREHVEADLERRERELEARRDSHRSASPKRSGQRGVPAPPRVDTSYADAEPAPSASQAAPSATEVAPSVPVDPASSMPVIRHSKPHSFKPRRATDGAGNDGGSGVGE